VSGIDDRELRQRLLELYYLEAKLAHEARSVRAHLAALHQRGAVSAPMQATLTAAAVDRERLCGEVRMELRVLSREWAARLRLRGDGLLATTRERLAVMRDRAFLVAAHEEVERLLG
jgi:hypothetical protein